MSVFPAPHPYGAEVWRQSGATLQRKHAVPAQRGQFACAATPRCVSGDLEADGAGDSQSRPRQSPAHEPCHRFGARADVQLLVDVPYVGVDRAGADVELIADLL